LDNDHSVAGFAGARTLHVGIDLDAPVGTKVFAFADGIIHAAGYNPELGDYGNVMVVEHDLGIRLAKTTATTTTTSQADTSRRKVWALYGHLDDKSIKGKVVGERIKKGQVLGRMGDFHENGGWYVCHNTHRCGLKCFHHVISHTNIMSLGSFLMFTFNYRYIHLKHTTCQVSWH
jgi:hypothetical protein